jgi:hypothetical protein
MPKTTLQRSIDMEQQAIEWAPFSLKAGVSEVDLIRASDEMQRQFLAGQRGFRRRELLKRDSGGFVDLVRWQSRESAEAAMRVAGSNAACAGYFALMRFDAPPQDAAGVQHLACLATYSAG